MEANIFVTSGEVWSTARGVILRADGIGSCGVVVAYDKKKKIGEVARIMLPGRSPKKGTNSSSKGRGTTEARRRSTEKQKRTKDYL